MTTTTEKITYGADKAGCWFDGCRGVYIGEAIIDCAIAHGAKIDPTPGPGERWADDDYYHELTDEADTYMQQFAADGYWFGFSEHAGDWGLWESEED